MTLSAPALGGLFGVGFVLLVGFAVQRGNAREQQRRLDLIRQKIERRQAQLSDSTQCDRVGAPPEPTTGSTRAPTRAPREDRNHG